MKSILRRDANQGFAQCVRVLEAGEAFSNTRNGTPVARLMPVAERRVLTAEREAAIARTKARRDRLVAAAAGPFAAEPFDREALHER